MRTESSTTDAGGTVSEALRTLLRTPLRQFQVLGIVVPALATWMFLTLGWSATESWRGDVPVGEVATGGLEERWYSFYLWALVWGHIPVFFLFLAAGAVLAVHSTVEAWREPVDELGLVREDPDLDPDRYVPPGFVIVGSFVIAVFTFGASGLAPVARVGPFAQHSVVQWAALGWLALIVLTAAAGVVRIVRRRSIRRRWEGTREAQRAAKARREAVNRRFAADRPSFHQLAGAQRAGRGDLLNEAERERIGADAGGWAIGALLGGMFGLGPVGLVAGFVALRRGGTAMWVGTLGLLLGAVQTLLIVGALAAAVVTG